MQLTLDYDLVGNLKSRDEVVEHKKETFGDDTLNRLVALISVEGNKDYKYDAAGRFTYKTGVGQYRYDPSEIDRGEFKPFHGVVETNDQNGSHYHYDLNGNMVSMPVAHLDYTADNQVKLIYFDEAKWSRFDYGPNGDRFRQFLRLGAKSEETLYVGLYERIIDYTLSKNVDYLHPSKFSGFASLSRSRNYISNGSGVFAVVETDEAYAATELYSPRAHRSGKQSTPKSGTLTPTNLALFFV